MRIRRAVAAAAATAVIAPAVLLAATTAHADEQDSATPAAGTASSAPAEDPAAGQDTPATEPVDEDEDATAPAEEPDTAEGPAGEKAEDATGADDDAGKPEDGKSDGKSDGKGEDEDASGGDEGGLQACDAEDTDFAVSDDLTTSLSGLPRTVVAGSGWHGFSLNLHNAGKAPIKNIAPYVAVWSENEDEPYYHEFALQAFDAATGTWKTVADEVGLGGYFSTLTLDAGERYSFSLRLKTDAATPDSLGVAVGAGEYSTAEGCWVSFDANDYVYFFDVLAKGSKPAKPGDAEPQTGGKKPIRAEKVSEVEVTGELAQTGSDSRLPLFALTGATAVALGTGALLLVRRRDTTPTTA